MLRARAFRLERSLSKTGPPLWARAANGSGVATFTTSTPLTVGLHTITASYGGDTNEITSASAILNQIVGDAAGVVTLAANPVSPSVFGQPVIFTATVAASPVGGGTPSGLVTFVDGSTAIGSAVMAGGVATFTTAAMAVGNTHSIKAYYGGDANFTPGISAALPYTVNQSGSTAALTSSANPSVFGQSIVLTATLTATSPGAGIPTGSVTFKDGATTLGTGTLTNRRKRHALALFPNLAIGGHSLTVVYGGDTNFITSTSPTLTQTVNQSVSLTALASSANPSVFGQTVTYTATVTASAPGTGIPTGTVTFKEGAVTLGSGTLTSGIATFTSSALAVGSHSLTAIYGGDTNFASSTSSALAQVVIKDNAGTVVSADIDPTVVGQTVTFTAAVSANGPGSGTPTGIVTFKDGATTLGTGALNGSGIATFPTAALTSGPHNITAIYPGDGRL